MSLPTVAIVGRPNVGKSSLFNRFLQKRLAVVHEQSGITRDRNYAVCDWNGVTFRLIDTGGMVPDADEMMDRLIYDQTEFAISEADLVIFVVDAQVGADWVDEAIARRLRQAKVKAILVANKADNERLELETYDFLRLGLDEPHPISATIGRNIGDLLDRVVGELPEQSEDEIPAPEVIRVAVVGRPNVGKSSFINSLTGSERAIVTPIAGTTRDAVDTPFEFEGRQYVLVDTAGLRKRYKVHENVEFYTTLRTARAIESCDVAVVLIDATAGVTSQDQHVLDEVVGNRRAGVLAVNKWDLVEKDSHTADKFRREILDVLARHNFLPIIFISALTGQRVPKVLEMVRHVHEQTHRRVTTSELNEFLQRVVAKQHPPSRAGRFIKLNYATQTEVAPPTFIFFANYPKLLDKSYIQYLSNQIRQQFGFEGVPIRLKFRRK